MLEGATCFIGERVGSKGPNLDDDDDDDGDGDDGLNLILTEVQTSCCTITSFYIVPELTQAITIHRGRMLLVVAYVRYVGHGGRWLPTERK
jgi:hypothetical protein